MSQTKQTSTVSVPLRFKLPPLTTTSNSTLSSTLPAKPASSNHIHVAPKSRLVPSSSGATLTPFTSAPSVSSIYRPSDHIGKIQPAQTSPTAKTQSPSPPVQTVGKPSDQIADLLKQVSQLEKALKTKETEISRLKMNASRSLPNLQTPQPNLMSRSSQTSFPSPSSKKPSVSPEITAFEVEKKRLSNTISMLERQLLTLTDAKQKQMMDSATTKKGLSTTRNSTIDLNQEAERKEEKLLNTISELKIQLSELEISSQDSLARLSLKAAKMDALLTEKVDRELEVRRIVLLQEMKNKEDNIAIKAIEIEKQFNLDFKHSKARNTFVSTLTELHEEKDDQEQAIQTLVERLGSMNQQIIGAKDAFEDFNQKHGQNIRMLMEQQELFEKLHHSDIDTLTAMRSEMDQVLAKQRSIMEENETIRLDRNKIQQELDLFLTEQKRITSHQVSPEELLSLKTELRESRQKSTRLNTLLDDANDQMRTMVQEYLSVLEKMKKVTSKMLVIDVKSVMLESKTENSAEIEKWRKERETLRLQFDQLNSNRAMDIAKARAEMERERIERLSLEQKVKEMEQLTSGGKKLSAMALSEAMLRAEMDVLKKAYDGLLGSLQDELNTMTRTHTFNVAQIKKDNADHIKTLENKMEQAHQHFLQLEADTVAQGLLKGNESDAILSSLPAGTTIKASTMVSDGQGGYKRENDHDIVNLDEILSLLPIQKRK